MKDGVLYALIIATLKAGLAANYSELGDVTIKQAYQPRTTGAPSGASILLSTPTPMRRYGFMRRANVWVPPVGPTPGYMNRTETQMWEQGFQCNAQILPPPQATALPDFTAGDLATAASWILQGDDGRSALKAGGCDIYRVTGIRSPYFKNEQNQFQQSPSFDFVLSYEEVKTFTTPIVTSEIWRIKGV